MAYTKKDWVDNEVITKEALNNIEKGIENVDKANTAQGGKITPLESKVTALEGKVVAATTAKQGLVKQATSVPEASGENVTKAEFKALLDALKTAGIMASE